jgi:hypothetical protein
LTEFRDYLRKRTDAPSVFHMHAGLCSLAVAMGTACWMDGPSREVFPNLNCVVLAPSGMGKSVPLDMAVNVVRKAGLGDRLLPSSFSQEGLLKQLSNHPVGLWVIQEFAAFQALLGRDYNSGAEQTLTELYDVPDVFVRQLRKSDDSFTLKHPCVTILGASSPDWFAQAFKGSALRGGWLARFLFAPSREAGEPIGDPGPREDGTEAGLAGHLRAVQELHGRFDMSACRPQYDAFARKCRLAARESSDFGGMRSRGPVMAQKVAMLFHVSRDPTTMALTVADMDQAIRFIEQTHAAAEFYLTNEVAHNREEESRLRLLDIIRGQGGRCSRTVALKNSHLTSRQFDEAAGTLVDSERLVRHRDGRTEIWAIPEFATSLAKPGELGEVGKTRNGAAGVRFAADPTNVRIVAKSCETDSPF